MNLNHPTMNEKKRGLTRRWANALLEIRVARLHDTDETAGWTEWTICDYAASFLPDAEKRRIHAEASRLTDSLYEGYAVNAGLETAS